MLATRCTAMAPAASLNNRCQSPPDNLQQLFFQQPATIPLCPQNKKTAEAKPRQINQTFLMFSQSLLQRSPPGMSEKNNYSKAKEPNEDNSEVKKTQLFHPAVSIKASPTTLTLHRSPSSNPLQSGQRVSGQDPSHETQLSRTQINHRMNKALKPKDKKIIGLSNPKP